MIINPYAFGPAYDPDAQAFFTASGLTGTTNLNAINQLVLDLKSYGIWTKMKAIYPFVGGTATSHKWNLKDPQDTNAAFRLVFSGGWTHSSTGALPNGTNAFANTFLNGDVMASNSIHICYYSRTNSLYASQEIGVLDSFPTNSYSDLGLRHPSVSNTAFVRLNNGGGVTPANPTSDSLGFYLGSRTGTNVMNLYKNNNNIKSYTDASTIGANNPFYIGALNNADAGFAAAYSNRECALASIGDGLNATEAANYFTAVNAYQVALSRNV